MGRIPNERTKNQHKRELIMEAIKLVLVVAINVITGPTLLLHYERE